MVSFKHFLIGFLSICGFELGSSLGIAQGQAHSYLSVHEQGPYLSVNYGHSAFSFSGNNELPGHGAGYGTWAGYQFSENWAAEIGYIRVEGEKSDISLLSVKGSLGSDTNIWHLAIKGTLPVDNRFSFFGKVGIAKAYIHDYLKIEDPWEITNAEEHHHFNKVGPFLGLGMEFAITKNLFLTGEYNGLFITKSENDDIKLKPGLFGLLSVGITYYF